MTEVEQLKRISKSVFETIVGSFEGRDFPQTEKELGAFIAEVCNLTDDAQLVQDQTQVSAMAQEIFRVTDELAAYTMVLQAELKKRSITIRKPWASAIDAKYIKDVIDKASEYQVLRQRWEVK